MIDYETLIDTLIRRDSTAASIGGEYDTDLLRTMPALVYRITGDGQQANADGLWTVTLAVYVNGAPADAWRVVSEIYDAVRAWPAPRSTGVVVGVGYVHLVTDVDMPSRQPTSPEGGNTGVQYQASWTLLLCDL